MLEDVESRIAAAVEAAGRPIEQARGLPADWYRDPAMFDLECSRIFRRTWMAVCFSHEISGTGDVFPARIAGSEIVVLRAPDGTAKAFHNICRHRAAVIVGEPAKAQKMLRCPYHWWTYGLDGRLRNAPYFEGRPEGRPGPSYDTSLAPVRCGEWMGIVFVNLDGAAPSLDEHVAPVAERWRDYAIADLPVFAQHKRTIPANWKVVMEGLLEVYHEHMLHKSLTLRLTDKGERDFEDVMTGDMMGFVSVMPYRESEGRGTALPRVPGMPATGPAPSEIFLLYPSVSLNLIDNHFVRTIWRYDNVRQTSWRSTWHFAPGADRAACEEVVGLWLEVRGEDLGAVAAVQAGMESRTDGAVETRYSPFWEPILQHFHLHVARGLQARA